MPRTLQNGYAPASKQTSIIPITKGGTGASTPTQAVINLGGLNTDLINAPGGLLRLDEHALIPTESLPSVVVTGSTINGPTSITINQVQVYNITNYNDFNIYNITPISGIVNRSGANITYTAPNMEGVGGFIINGRVISITILGIKPAAPTITAPVSNAINTGVTVSATASAFSMVSGSDTHNASDWQIASDSLFTNIVTQSLNDTTNKTSWTSAALSPNTTYYIRVRYKGTTYGYGNWSNINVFNTGTITNITTQEAVVVSSDAATGDNFGYAVAMDSTGTRIAVSAPLNDNAGGGVDRGAVYIFLRSGVSWIQEAKIQLTYINNYENAGYSISLNSDGTRIAIGSNKNDIGGTDIGSVEIYSRSGTIWSFEAVLQASDKTAGDQFGFSVMLSADATKLIIGAPYSGSNDVGKAYLYTRVGTVWTETIKLSPSDGLPNDHFGWFVGISGDGTRIAISAPDSDPLSLIDAGAVYIFNFNVVWLQETKLTASNKSPNDHFGVCLTINNDGTRIAVGVPESSPGGISYAGSVYVLFRNGSNVWSEEAILTASDKNANDRYGKSISISDDGSQIVIGASTKLVGGTNRGQIYLSKRSVTTWNEVVYFPGSSNPSISGLGSSISMAGDKSRVVSGAPYSTPVGVLSGCCTIYK